MMLSFFDRVPYTTLPRFLGKVLVKSEKMRAAARGFTNLVQLKDGNHIILGRYVGQDLLLSSSLLSFRGVNSKPQGPWLEAMSAYI